MNKAQIYEHSAHAGTEHRDRILHFPSLFEFSWGIYSFLNVSNQAVLILNSVARGRFIPSQPFSKRSNAERGSEAECQFVPQKQKVRNICRGSDLTSNQLKPINTNAPRAETGSRLGGIGVVVGRQET